MPGVTTGAVDAIDHTLKTVQIGAMTYYVATPDLLVGLRVGLLVIAVWSEVGDQRHITKVDRLR